MDAGANTDNSDGDSGRGVEHDDAPLPRAYGSDRLELMVRNPTSAHAYWEIDIDRVTEAGGGPGGRKTFLRLLEVPSGFLVAEQEVPPERGSHGFALPIADSSYVVELAIMRDYRWVVLARSNVVHTPPTTPTAATAPVFVTRAEQARALAEGLALRPAGGRGQPVPPRIGERPEPGPTVGGPYPVAWHVPAGSEPRPRGVGSEPRLADRSSEARLLRREPLHIPFVISRTPGTPGPVAAALGALASTVWSGGHPTAVLAAGNALASALADAGISSGPAIAILDPPEHDTPAADPGGPDAARADTDRHTVTHNPDGSITVLGPDGSSVTYSPVPSQDTPAARSAAAIVGTRYAP